MMTTKEVLPKMAISEATMYRVLPIGPVSPNGDSDHHGNVTQEVYVTGAGDETIHPELPTEAVSDARPAPKPRKYPRLWQSYLWWYTVVELRKKYTLRISSIERGKSAMDAIFERDMIEQVGLTYLGEMDVSIEQMEKVAKEGNAIDFLVFKTKKAMIVEGTRLGPIWTWVTSIKGLAQGGLAAQLLAQIDDIDNCPTVASLWRFAGFAVIEGKAEKNAKGEKSKSNRRLKGICFNIADSFIKQQTPHYVGIYYAEKEKQRQLNPDILCRQCGCQWVECQDKKKHVKIFTDAHIHNRAWRKMIKTFLRDLWVEWKKESNLNAIRVGG